MSSARPLLSIVAPFFDEEANVDLFFDRLLPVLDDIGETYEIVCVNDGSRDGTLDRLIDARSRSHAIRVLDLSRNFGKEAALTAGLDHVAGDAVIPIDSDLQDPPELIAEMVAKWREGYDVVLARRADRSTDHPLKRWSAGGFYWLHNKISDVQLPENVGDFRLMDRRVVEAVRQLPERQRFMKGLFAWAGFRQAVVTFKREARPAGETSFSGWRLWNFALDGVTSFSTVPLKLWTYIGAFVAFGAFLYACFILVRVLFFGIDTPGYASLMVVVLFFGGIQLLCLGILGEYVGRVLVETKQRPVYLMRDIHEASIAKAEKKPDTRPAALRLHKSKVKQ